MLKSSSTISHNKTTCKYLNLLLCLSYTPQSKNSDIFFLSLHSFSKFELKTTQKMEDEASKNSVDKNYRNFKFVGWFKWLAIDVQLMLVVKLLPQQQKISLSFVIAKFLRTFKSVKFWVKGFVAGKNLVILSLGVE